ncbi:type ISP restriction/modification enzyme [Mesorhizobium sp. M0500]|uniref:type ISP restriction/modification enzyme n=1 Tax=Mesorhizobium sp. M0500 TaxID=2956953 RepID=UPI003335F66A
MLDTGRLDEITTFPRLLEYLRNHLDWPIEDESFDDLTFDYTPSEFGLKLDGEKGKIEIKQLRPLSSSQPFGIFFLNFPGKAMPVTVLRRILGSLTKKKRESANPAERAVWVKHDLLFISSFGQSGQRQLSFAHFQDRSDMGDLPALRVLGWDGQNTIRRLSYTNDTLKKHLVWPENTGDLGAWRENWSGAFTEGKGESVTTAKAMARELARLARQIRTRANELLEAETEQGPLRQLHTAFKEALIHDLTPDDFADMYSQTVAYGLLSARISRESGALVADDAALMAPPTNPFLQELLANFLQAGGRKGGVDFDELGVNEIVEMLRDANMEAVLLDFDDKNPQEDPVIHFYELFLKEYDAKKRMQRGVFYTPRPVVSFIVRSVDEVLRTEFGLEDGLADTTTWGEMVARKPEIRIPEGEKPSDPFVKILDPATGTGTFLVEVIGLVHERMLEKWRKAGKSKQDVDAFWNAYVEKHLLPRLYGFELMMAPYAIAHMKLGLKLADTGYHFRSKERARIFLTNALEEPRDFDLQLAFMSEALAHEAKAANEAKGKARFTVVIGNPPYAGISSNMSASASLMIEEYKTVDGNPLNERKHWLHDDYVKFTRFAQQLISKTGTGTIGLITNHGYLDNPTFRGMRRSLLNTFQRIRAINLHGSAKRRPHGTDLQDENVFDIEQGVAIGLYVSAPNDHAPSEMYYSELIGSRAKKYGVLQFCAEINSLKVSYSSPYYFFVPRDDVNRKEFESFPQIRELMLLSSTAIQTSRDHLSVAFDRTELRDRITHFADSSLTDDQIRAEYFPGRSVSKYQAGDTRQWSLSNARQQIRANLDWQRAIRTCLYRPFDKRQVIYDPSMVDWPRGNVMQHLLDGSNLALLLPRQLAGDSYRHALCTNTMVEMCAISTQTKEQNNVFPLWLKPTGADVQPGPNLSRAFIKRLAYLTGLAFDDGAHGAKQVTFGARDVFDWIYAVLYSPAYRKRYADFLKSDFARIPLPKDRALFKALIPLGTRLVALHLVDVDAAPDLKDPAGIRFAGSGAAAIPPTGGSNGYPRFVNGRLYINSERWFEEVPKATFEFYVGGYRVCEKWLKDRRGRTLTTEDVLHYRRIVHALTETRKVMAEIDKVIEAHGGWPDAFKGMEQKETEN